MSGQSDAITSLFRACEPNEPLHSSDPRYVNCDEVRGQNLVEWYVRSLRRADPARPEIKLFAGHRGVGKTSELNRLKAELEKPVAAGNPHAPFRVLYMDASEKLDLNDLDLPDLLTFIASEVLGQLARLKVAGFDPVSTLINLKNARMGARVENSPGNRMVRAGSYWQNRFRDAFCGHAGEPWLPRNAPICRENGGWGHRSDCVTDAPPGKIGTFRGPASARWSERPGETLVGGDSHAAA